MKKKYSITGIDCANCAAKLESKMNELPQVEDVVLTFATQQLLVVAENPDEVLPELQQLADKMEPGTKIGPLSRKRNTGSGSHGHEHHHEHHHEHEESCNCGHGHHHNHEHHHDHEEGCNCGHEHHHGHEEGCDCGHGHHRNHGHHQEHEEICSCSHGQHHDHDHHHDVVYEAESYDDVWWKSKEAVTLLSGAVLFGIAMLLEHFVQNVPYLGAICFVAAYVVLGMEVVVTAVRNMFRGKVFDENFLMTIATIGAFVIGDFAEAVGVMLFYQIGEFFEDVAVNKSRKQIMEAVDMRPEMVRLD